MNPDNNVPQTPPPVAPPPTPVAPQAPLPPAGPIQPPPMPVSPATPPQVPATPAYQEPPKKKSPLKIVLIVIGVIILIFFLFFVLIGTTTAEPTKVAQQFISDMQSNNVDDAYSLAAPEFQQATPKDQFTQFMTKENQALPKATPSIVSRSIATSNGSTTSTIVANLKDDQGAPFVINVQLVKENGKWLVLSVDVK